MTLAPFLWSQMNQTKRERLNEQLKQLALLAQQSKPQTKQRQLALTQMSDKILQSGHLSRPRSHRNLRNYEEIYNESVQELFLYICEKIEKYEPERGSVLAWCNTLLERRFFKMAAQKLARKSNIQEITSFELDNLALLQEPPFLSEIVKECIEADPDNLFKKEQIKDCPQANFQALASRRIAGKSWKEIAQEFNLNMSSLSTFYYRCIEKFAAKLKEYCRDRVI
jgi:DNA-directed RNA polymerase specialized sigma24 family protein